MGHIREYGVNGLMTGSSILVAALLLAGPGCSKSEDGGGGAEQTSNTTGGTTETPTDPTPADPVEVASTTPDDADVPMIPGPATISFANMNHDFGTVSDTSSMTATFDFTNTGTGTLEITRLKPSCGCTNAVASRMKVPPGESATLDVTYEPRGTGKHSYRVSVFSNDEENERVDVKFTAQVDPFVLLEPRDIKLGTVEMGQPHTGYVTLLYKTDDLEIDELDIRQEHVTARVVENPADDIGAPTTDERPHRTVIEVSVDPEAPWGELRRTLRMRVRGNEGGTVEKSLLVPISASVFGELQVEPVLYRLGVIEPGADVEHSIVISHRDGAPFRIVSVRVKEANVPGLRVETEPNTEEGGGYLVFLRGNFGSHLGPVHGSVEVLTDVEDAPTNQIRFSGIVRTRNTP